MISARSRATRGSTPSEDLTRSALLAPIPADERIEGERWLIRLRRAALRGALALAAIWGMMIALSSSSHSATVLFTQQGGVGIPPPSGSLDFGDAARGLATHRTINLQNNGVVDTYVIVFSWGGIRDFLSIDDAFFNLSPGEQHGIDISVVAPANASPERHSGRVFIVRIPWWPF